MTSTRPRFRSPRPRRPAKAKAAALLLALVLAAAATATTTLVARAGILDKKETASPEEEADGSAALSGEEEPVCAADDASCSSHGGPSGGDDANQQEQQQQQQQPPATDKYRGPPTEPPTVFECTDIEDNCLPWSQTRVYSNEKRKWGTGCEINAAYMTHYCPVQCETCDQVRLGWDMSQTLEGGLAVIPFCQDHNFDCAQFADGGECNKNPEYMEMFCEASCGICAEKSNLFGVGQRLYPKEPEKTKLIQARLDNSVDYMRMVRREPKYEKVRKDCLNKVPDCTMWAVQGECENNQQYMIAQCAPACMMCEALGDTSEPAPDRCTNRKSADGPLWKKGDLNAFFEAVVDGEGGYYERFRPTALSRPERRGDGSTVPGASKDGPWVVLLEDFLSAEEADRIVQIGHEQGYERSVRALEPGTFGETDGRTSDNTWCKEPSCMEDPLVAGVLKRIAKFTKSTANHFEHLQMLRYKPGEFYGPHHDYIPYQLEQPCGPRVMTLFLYLNEVEEGGETRFPFLDVSVTPKKGSALLWPSVKDEDPTDQDPRMEHEAREVVRGVKYGANAWIHSEDFQTPFALKCLE